MRIFEIVAVLLLSVTSCARSASECDNPVPVGTEKVVVLTGVLKQQTYFGPPGLGDNPESDAKYTGHSLVLDEKICVYARRFEEDEVRNNLLADLNLRTTGESIKQFTVAPVEHVKVTGTLRLAVVPSDHTPVVMEVSNIER